MPSDLSPFFAPAGVALIGASPNPRKIGHAVLHNLTRNGYCGAVYPINPNYPEVAGLTCYPAIADVPDPVDLAVVVLPTPLIPNVLHSCGERGIKAVIIISAGFKESGADGAASEAECLVIAHRYGMRLIGPNCVGTMDLYSGLNTTFIEGVPLPGSISFVSQSGGICGGGIDYIKEKQVGFSRFVSLGNEADVTETDVIEFLADDPHTRVIALYVEQIRDGSRFMAAARRVTPHKPIVMLRAGRTRAGIAAVSSHTGALAGSNQAYEAAFKQCGIIEARSIRELFDISLALAFQPVARGGRVFVLSNSGGPAALVADDLSELNVCLPPLSPQIESRLLAGLDSAVLPGNPIDMLGGAGPAEFEFALPIVLSDPAIDAVLVVMVPHLLLDPTETARRICRAAAHAHKPIITCFVGGPGVRQARRVLHQHHIPMFTCPRAASRVIDALGQYAVWRQQRLARSTDISPKIDGLTVNQLLTAANSRRKLGEAETRPVFSACSIPIIAGGLAHSAAQAVELADRLNYPVVLKIVAPHILHKSEAGGVRLNLHNGAAVTKAYQQLIADSAALNPGSPVEGVLVEKMAPRGHEVIVGMRRDPQFGPLLMFGLGGIYVELLTDVSFRVAPIDRSEALAMIHETKAGRLLSGLRGQPPAHIEAVADCLLQLGQLALEFPQIEEVEINPLLVLPHGQGAVALDGRIVLAANWQRRGEKSQVAESPVVRTQFAGLPGTALKR